MLRSNTETLSKKIFAQNSFLDGRPFTELYALPSLRAIGSTNRKPACIPRGLATASGLRPIEAYAPVGEQHTRFIIEKAIASSSERTP